MTKFLKKAAKAYLSASYCLARAEVYVYLNEVASENNGK